MKCPTCGAPTEVKETRIRRDHVFRRRICFNEHKFTTEERLRKLVKSTDAGGTAQVVAFHEARPQAVSKSKKDRPT